MSVLWHVFFELELTETFGRYFNSANSISKTEVTIMYSNNCDCEKNNYISYINCYLQFQDWSQNRGTETWGITIWLEKVEFWYWGHHDCCLPRAHSLFSTIKIYIMISLSIFLYIRVRSLYCLYWNSCKLFPLLK